MEFLQNAWLLGLVTVVLVWAIRRLGWALDSKAAIWLTFGVSFVLALVQVTVQGQWGMIPSFPAQGDPFAIGEWVLNVLGVVAQSFGQVLAASQVIYKALRETIAKWYPKFEL